MKRVYTLCVSLLTLTLLIGTNPAIAGNQAETPNADLPVLLTSCGQSPGATMIKVIFMRMKLESEPKPYEINEMATADELARASKLIEEARRQGITVIGAHIEGMKRRAQGAAVGDNTDELSIDCVAPNSDLLVIIKEGNADNRFTIIAKAKNIPMIEVEKLLDLKVEFEKIFKK